MDTLPALIADVLPFVAIGFIAQLVDGALGMAFGVISTSLLIGLTGVPPAHASASVHLAETVTTGASGASHAFLRNVDWRLFSVLAVPGVIGGVAGALAVSAIDADAARPLVMLYLGSIGIWLLVRACRRFPKHDANPRFVAAIGTTGGFLDAAGGGGWGPLVVSNLLLQGSDPRKTIGTVNACEFVLTISISITFVFTLGLEAFTRATLGLLIGGVIAAPLGALMVRWVRPRALLALVGTAILSTSVYGLFVSSAGG